MHKKINRYSHFLNFYLSSGCVSVCVIQFFHQQRPHYQIYFLPYSSPYNKSITSSAAANNNTISIKKQTIDMAFDRRFLDVIIIMYHLFLLMDQLIHLKVPIKTSDTIYIELIALWTLSFDAQKVNIFIMYYFYYFKIRYQKSTTKQRKSVVLPTLVNVLIKRVLKKYSR